MKIDKSEHEVIYNKKKNGETVINIAKEYGVRENTIYRIIEAIESSIDHDNDLYKSKIEFEKQRNMKRIKDLAKKYNLNIMFLGEKNNCKECLQKDKLIEQLQTEVEKNNQEVEKNNQQQEVVNFWDKDDFIKYSVYYLQKFKTKSVLKNSKIKALKKYISDNIDKLAFQEGAPLTHQIKNMIKEDENCDVQIMYKKYANFYHPFLQQIWT